MPKAMSRLSRIALFATLVSAIAFGQAYAQQDGPADIREERMSFDTGQDHARLSGRLTGYDVIDYIAHADAGQTLVVTMTTDSTATYFNILAPGETDVAIHTGSIEGNSFAALAEASGDYRVRVYQMRSAARRNEIAAFTLNLQVTSADFADGLQGGPDFWEVSTQSATGQLNIRSQPSTDSLIVIAVDKGTVLRNGGCRISDGTRWCSVETLTEAKISGWAAGEFLIESGYVEPR